MREVYLGKSILYLRSLDQVLVDYETGYLHQNLLDMKPCILPLWALREVGRGSSA
jgi:hypothetical protein